MADAPRRVLLVTLPPQILGGVGSQAMTLAGHLRDTGHSVSLAYYAARSLKSHVNASLFSSVFGGHGTVEQFVDGDGYENYVVGCRFSELEYSYSKASENWRGVFADHDRHIAVGGSPVIANPLVDAGLPHFLWCADDLDGDRKARHEAMPIVRRAISSLVIEPVLKRQQSVVLAGSTLIRGISNFTVSRLRAHGLTDDSKIDRMPIPIDVDFFVPSANGGPAGRIGFAGRIGDPRKNAGLLFEAMTILRQRGVEATLHIAGPRDTAMEQRVENMKIAENIEFLGVLSREDLRSFYQHLDVLVFSSLREGLGLSALEAMACGVPVVATRCGGPDDYVRDGETGFFAGFDASDFADKLARVIGNRERRGQMVEVCRDTAVSGFSEIAFSQYLDEAWHQVWGESYLLEENL